MTPAFVVIHMYQGQTFDPIIILNDNTGVPLDLSTRAARMQVREYKGGPVVLDLSSAGGQITLSALGEVGFHVTAAATAALDVQGDSAQWVYDLELFYDNAGEEIVERPVYGVIVFHTEITQ